MSLADASLVRMSELDVQTTIVTLDDDFRVYRRNRRHSNRTRIRWVRPPASTTSASPVAMRRAASHTASSPEPHRRFTVTAGTS